jgi:hypothetical protein
MLPSGPPIQGWPATLRQCGEAPSERAILLRPRDRERTRRLARREPLKRRGATAVAPGAWPEALGTYTSTMD